MDVKNETPIGQLPANAPAFLKAYFEFSHLKQLYRQGWLRRAVPKNQCESVAEHSFGVALLALWLVQQQYPELDGNKVLRMALLHDFGEVYAGDIIPGDPMSAEEKHQQEDVSVRQVFEKLPSGQEYISLWQEFEQGQTAEARLVRQLDRLEMGLQAAVYRSQGLGDLAEFSASARQALSEPEWLELLTQAEALTGLRESGREA